MTVASFEKATAFITDARLYPKSVFLKHMCLTRVSSLAEDVQMYLWPTYKRSACIYLYFPDVWLKLGKETEFFLS